MCRHHKRLPSTATNGIFNTLIHLVTDFFHRHRLLGIGTEGEVRDRRGGQYIAITRHHVHAIGFQIQRFCGPFVNHRYIQRLAFQLVGIAHEIHRHFFVGRLGGVIHTYGQAGRLFHVFYCQVIHVKLSLCGEYSLVSTQGNALQYHSYIGCSELQDAYRVHALEGIVHPTVVVGGSLGSQVVMTAQVSHAVVSCLLLVGIIHGHSHAVEHNILDEGEVGIVLVIGLQSPCTSVEGSVVVARCLGIDGEIHLRTLIGQDADAVAFRPYEFQLVVLDGNSCTRTFPDAMHGHFGEDECTQARMVLRVFIGSEDFGLFGTGTERQHRHDDSHQVKIQIFHAVVLF